MPNKSIKSKFYQDKAPRQTMSIAQYVERREEHKNHPARLVNGIMLVLLHGHYISQTGFLEVCPVPVIADFHGDKNNPDSTHSWIHK